MARNWRPAWLPENVTLREESVLHPHCPQEQAELFLSADATSTEIETLNFMHALACLLKPEKILETGTAKGLGTIALASACRDNGFGKVHSLEIEAGAVLAARDRLSIAGLASYADIHCADSRDWLLATEHRFGLGFFDSEIEIRAEEFAICRNRGMLTGAAAFHDTSPRRFAAPAHGNEKQHAAFRADVTAFARRINSAGFFESRLSRGLMVIFFPEDSIRV